MAQPKQAKKIQNSLLPEDSLSALKIMTQLTRQLLDFVIEEGKLLKKKEMTTLAQLQHGKELRAAGYARAVTEFQGRIAEFKGLDAALIDQLETYTFELGKVTRTNQTLIEGMSPQKPLQENFVHNLFLLQADETQAAQK